MFDFLIISARSAKGGVMEIYPDFRIIKSKDLMIRGGDFYAIWLEDQGLWSTDELDALQQIDRELDNYAEKNHETFNDNFKILHMCNSRSGMIDQWHKYCQRQMRDSFHMLDEKLIFSNTKVKKTDYASKRLNYPLEQGEMPAYNRLMSVLYSDDERRKIEWAIGSIVCGDSKTLQKFVVLYGAAGTGKSTVLNIIQQLFDGYYSVFDAKALGSSNNSFALEAFKTNPLVAIQHDGDLSRIEDNTRLNSLVSHEMMTVNEKFKSTYANQFKCFLFMGTNKPVRITDAKSGLIRRLIDVTPTGDKISVKEYHTLTKQISFELGAIAYHCQEVYQANPNLYDNYIPITMLGASNDFYNFVVDSYFIFQKENGTTLKAAWDLYKRYCEEAKVSYPFSQRIFKEELRNYFQDYKERYVLEDGTRVRSYYIGFKIDKFEENDEKIEPELSKIIFSDGPSKFDELYAYCPAQYASANEIPVKKWDDVSTTLADLDTTKLHYVKVPKEHIVIDFDLPDSNQKKSLERNLEEASKWPPTYTELSKSGCGVHLHYIYTGDVSKLSRVYDEHIEVKVFIGKSSLRRKLTKCNDIPIATIGSGLPLKGETNVINYEAIKSEKQLVAIIKKNLRKEIHPYTKPSIDFIYKILEDAYASGLHYDISDMHQAILAFAANSSHNSEYCVKMVSKMHFKSDEPTDELYSTDERIVFFDVEVFPNLFIIVWKLEGADTTVVHMINPSPDEVKALMGRKLVGFNCRRYDNHILYARGVREYSIGQLFELSKMIISNKRDAFFGEAYNISYTDVYDFSSEKQSLKKFEIELGIHHKELGLPWDRPVPKDQWERVAEYCDNDVIATEAVFNARRADFTARQILAEIAGMTVNDTTNSLTARIIFGKNRHPQDQFNYRFMGDISEDSGNSTVTAENVLYSEFGDEYTIFDEENRPVFPGYTFENGVSMYRGREVGEGGYVYAEPGMYTNVALLDIASMHPSSIIAENLFGDEYTARFRDILNARLAIKHKDYESARKMLGGALAGYLTDESAAADLAQALKIAINSVYGLTAARFDNPFRDPRNKDNIVAKRGALFMINLQNEVQSRGFTVVHIKTDSIKVLDATPEIIQFIFDYGKMYGYTFEHEATFEKICLVNHSEYIAKGLTGKHAGEWTATGKRFAIPYLFKTLFSHEPIEFEDLCETKAVTSELYLDMNESLPDVHESETLAKKEENPSEELLAEVAKGHDYHYVGRVGSFCPMVPGSGGGLLLRKDSTGGYSAAADTKGYRWMEAEMVKTLEKEDCIDRSYYDRLVDQAVNDISELGDLEWFLSDEPQIEEDQATLFDLR